jgi:hypothetical protein
VPVCNLRGYLFVCSLRVCIIIEDAESDTENPEDVEDTLGVRELQEMGMIEEVRG